MTRTVGWIRSRESDAGRPWRAGPALAAVLALALAAWSPLAARAAPPTAPSGIGDLVAAASKPKPRLAAKPAGNDDALVLSGWSLGGDAASTVFTFDLARPAALRLFTLAEPTRVVVELPTARFEPASEGGRAANGLVAAWRFGAFAAGRSRLVLDTRGAVRIARADFAAGAPEGRSRLVVELVPSTREQMAEARTIDLAPQAPVGHDATGALAKGDRGQISAPPTAPAGRLRPVVVIDPGHGGGDAGTVSPATGMPEKTVVLEMAKVLAKRLRDSGRYEVVVTRTEDVFLPLGERVRIARARHADLFLSIHADAEYDHSVRGATVYTLAETASDEQAAALAAKENQSDALAGHVVEEAESAVADILADLTLRETRRLSHAFARDILDAYRRNGRLVKGTPHRQAGLKVLRAHDVPSALVELGFLSNTEDEALLTSPDWREKTAASLIGAIDRWFAERGALAEPTKDGGGRAQASP